MRSRKTNLLGVILLLLYIGVLVYLCFGKFDDIPQVHEFLFGIPYDKIAHFVMFAPMAPMIYMSFVGHIYGPWKTLALVLGIFLLSCVFAALTEIGQGLLTTYRTEEPVDFRFDAVSIAISSLCIFVHYLFRRK